MCAGTTAALATLNNRPDFYKVQLPPLTPQDMLSEAYVLRWHEPQIAATGGCQALSGGRRHLLLHWTKVSKGFRFIWKHR